MKYPQLVSSTTPASLQDWLEEELESRGIDGVYTRYILSLLQQDTADLEPSECEHTSLNNQHNKYAQQVGNRDYPLSNSGKAKHQRWKTWERERLHGPGICCCSCGLELDSEERKKSAAVECLKSASEQKSGIEKLIDEVCAKLKKIKSSTGEEHETAKTILDNSDRITCNEVGDLPPSSPQEQAEKYYAAFPALNSKPEPLTKLCHQQERKGILKSVWDGRKIIEHSSEKDENFTISELDVLEFGEQKRDNSLDRQSDTSEKENAEIREKDETTCQIRLKTCKFLETSKKSDSNQLSQKPSFIVPKMKTSSQRIPFSVKYLPFNQLKTKHIRNTSFFEKKGENEIFEISKNVESDTFEISKNIDFENPSEAFIKEIPHNIWNFNDISNLKNYPKGSPNENLDSLFEHLCDNCGKLGLLMCAALSDVAFSEKHVCENEDDLLAALAGKFNSNLAAIWGKGDSNEFDSDSDSKPMAISLKFTPDIDVLSSEDSINKDLPSVWTFNKDDFKIVKDQKLSLESSLFYLTNVTHDSTNLPKLLRNISLSPTDPEISFETNSCFYKNTADDDTENIDSSSNIHIEYTETKIGEQTTECDDDSSDDSVIGGCDDAEEEDDLENILSACPKSLNNFRAEPSSSDGSDRGSTTPSDSLTGAVKGVYSLWKSASPDSALVFGMDLEKIWEPSVIDEKSNWIGIPFHEEKLSRDWSDTDLQEASNFCQCHKQWGSDDNWKNKANDSTNSRIKCTLTYHKGESRFVEVIPSKNKGTLLENGLCSNEMQEVSDTLETGVKCLSVNEEENLLTSPKTHFQPIRQESTDTETSDDAEVIMLTVQSLESPVNTKEFIKDSEQSEIHSVVSVALSSPGESSNMTNSEVNRQLTPSPQQRLPSDDLFKSPAKDRKHMRAVSSSFDELVSLTGQFNFEGVETPCICNSEVLTPVKFAPLYTWKCNHYMDKGTNTDILTPPQHDNIQNSEEISKNNKINSADKYIFPPYQVDENAWQLSPTSRIPGSNRKHSEWKWSTNDDEHTYWNGSDPSVGWNDNILENFGSGRLSTDKPGCGNLTALRKEIKEEEEQLFKDISCVNEGDKDFLLSVNDNLELQKVVYKSTMCKEQLIKKKVFGGLDDELAPSEEHLTLFTKADFLEWNDPSQSFSDDFSGDLYDSCFSLGDCDLDDGILPAFPSVPADKILYSSDLEDEWRKNSQPFGVQVPRKNRIKYKGPPQKRPCSFYLEGNCRRSDCRFSHDLATITCRFWEEGSCFKGVTCPFLHGYPSESDCWHEESGISECNYTLESEADFPSLSKLSNVTSDSKTSLRSSVYGKPIRPRRKKGKSLPGDLQNVQLSALSSSWSRCTSQDTAPESSDDA